MIVGAVTLRVSMIPLLYYSASASKNMATAREDIERLSKPYAEAVKRASSSSERWQKAMIYYRGLRAAWRIHDAESFETVRARTRADSFLHHIRTCMARIDSYR